MRTPEFPTVLVAAVIASLVVCAGAALANPPFINMLYPPPGVIAPREDPSAPHALPTAPAHAAACQESGAVKLALTIGTDGGVSEALVTSSSGYADLDAAASVGARGWRYVPATKDSSPIAVRITTTVFFAPDTKAPDFQADCGTAGMQAAVDAIAHGQ
jgi:TonB family protein